MVSRIEKVREGLLCCVVLFVVLVGYVLCFVFVGGLRVGCCGKGSLVV